MVSEKVSSASEFGRSDDARDKSRDRVDDRHDGDLTAAQDVVPDRELLADLGARALVDALVAPADEEKGTLRGQLPDHSLVQSPALRREQDRSHPRHLAPDPAQRANERLGLEHHAGPTAEGDVVHLPVATGGEVAEVVDTKLDIAALEGTPDHADPEGAGEDFREDGQHLEPHLL